MSQNTVSRRIMPPANQVGFSTKQKAQALVKLIDAKGKIYQALSVVPNASNRAGIASSLNEGIRNLCEDILNEETK